MDELEQLKKENEELKEDLEQYKQLGIMHFERPYAKRYLEEKRKEIKNLLYPDSEKIYMEYYALKDSHDKAIKYIKENYPVCAGSELLKILDGE